MALAYSVRFCAGTLTPPSTLTYTVPAGKVAVVRSISLTTGGTGSINGAVTVRALTFIYQSPSMLAYVTSQWEGRQVVNSGEVIEVTSSGGLWAMVSGYLLDNTP